MQPFVNILWPILWIVYFHVVHAYVVACLSFVSVTALSAMWWHLVNAVNWRLYIVLVKLMNVFRSILQLCARIVHLTMTLTLALSHYGHSVMTYVTWPCINQSTQHVVVGHTIVYRRRILVSASATLCMINVISIQMPRKNSRSPPNSYTCCIGDDRWNGRHEPTTTTQSVSIMVITYKSFYLITMVSIKHCKLSTENYAQIHLQYCPIICL